MDASVDPPPEPRRSRLGPEQGPGIGIEVLDPHALLGPAPLAWLHRCAVAALAELAARTGATGEVRALIVDDARMARVHEERCGVAGTTDVVTFDLAPDNDALLDADLYICADEAARRGAELGHPAERELLLYILHGALHCVGHDDLDEAAHARMHALEDEILSAIGVGATFAPGRAAGARP